MSVFEIPSVTGVIDYRQLFSPPAAFLTTNIKPWENQANRLDPELLHVHSSNQTVTGETVGDLVHWLGIKTERSYRVDLKYDGNGFRNNSELELAPIVMIGDSFVEGVLVPQSELVSSRLQRLLDIDVANLGQSGYGPQQELVTLRRYGLRLQPKVVLWFFFEGNDLLDISRYEKTRRNWDKIVRSRNSFVERSFVRNLLFTLSGYTSPVNNADGVEAERRSGRFGIDSDTQEKIYFAYGEPMNEGALKNIGTLQSIILEARHLSADHDAKFLLVFVPTKFRVYREFCEFPDNGYGRLWRPDNLPVTLEHWSEEQGLDYLDLTPALKKQAAKGELTYFIDDGHWNEKGHQVAAAAIGDRIAGALKKSDAAQ